MAPSRPTSTARSSSSAKLHGVPTPLNELLQRLANTFARERRAAGSLPVAELVRLADEAVAFVQEERAPRP